MSLGGEGAVVLFLTLAPQLSRPPELLESGTLTKAADVYAFGVILWEIYSGRRAWAGSSMAQVRGQRGWWGERSPISHAWHAIPPLHSFT